ncbi:MAG: NRDE family protein [Gammaproteobacteria bacterium]|nr:NRDE family protein [Gammaproteobacteria bacterium]
MSILRDNNGLIVTSNRDELRTRNEAGLRQKSTVGRAETTQCIYPVDAQAQGTWVGANDYGIVASLLNMYEADYQADPALTKSRGLIIPRLLEFRRLRDVRKWLTQSLEPRLYNAFVLLVMDKNDLYRYRWDGLSLNEECVQFSHYFLESSSSVDLAATVMYRQNQFKDWQITDNCSHNRAQSILRFHCKHDEDNASKSICVAREQSHTKSVSQIQISNSHVDFRYLSPDNLAGLINTNIDIKQLEVARHELLVVAQAGKVSQKASAA